MDRSMKFARRRSSRRRSSIRKGSIFERSSLRYSISSSGRSSVLDRLFTAQELGDIDNEDAGEATDLLTGKVPAARREEDILEEKALPNEPQGVPVERKYENKAMEELQEKSQTTDTSKRLFDRTLRPHLFGRDDELKQLMTLVNKSGSGTAVAVIRGPSGCGKTSLCEALYSKLNSKPHEEWVKYVRNLKFLQEGQPSSSPRLYDSEDDDDKPEIDSDDRSIDLGVDIDDDIDPSTLGPESIKRPTTVYISGTFDPFRSNVPYAAIFHALDSLGSMLCDLQKALDTRRGMGHLHSESNPKEEKRRMSATAAKISTAASQQSLSSCMNDNDLNAILELLTNEGKVLAQVIPSLKMLVKKADPARLTPDGFNCSMGFSTTDFNLQRSKRNMGFDSPYATAKPVISFGASPSNAKGPGLTPANFIKGLALGISPVPSRGSGGFNDSTSSNLGMSLSNLSVKEVDNVSVETANSEGNMLTERLILGVSTFLKLFCAPHRRLVWLLDDLQWADKASLRLIETIVSDQIARNLVILFGYRDLALGNENSSRVSFSTATAELNTFFECLPAESIDIRLGNLEEAMVTRWLASLMKQRQDDSAFQLLAQLVHRKTAGNPYFALQYLELLQRKKLLWFSSSSDAWEWDMALVMALATKSRSGISSSPDRVGDIVEQVASAKEDSVAEVINFQISSAPSSVQRLIQVASCLGFYFDAPLLRGLCEQCDALLLLGFSVENKGIYYEDDLDDENYEEDDGTVDEDDEDDDGSGTVYKLALEQAEADGLVEKTSDPRIYKFAHDNIQKTIYESMAQGKERMLLHLRIGQHIMELGDERFVLDAAEQFNRGSALLVHETERLDLIELNLEACGQALERAGISMMADFLNKAIAIIKDHDWINSYNLVLDVYSRSAEAEFARGNNGAAQRRVEEVLMNALTLDDQLSARYVKLEISASQCDYAVAIRESRKLLSELGERLPRADQLSFALEYRKTRKLVQAKNDDELLNLPQITLERPIWIAKILQTAASFGWRGGDQQFTELVFVRMMRFCLMYGGCESTPSAFAGYGWVSSNYGEVGEGRRFADLAVRQIKSKSSIPAVGVLVHLNLSHLIQPAAESLEPLLVAYRTGLEIGVLNFGALAVQAYASLYLFCGLPLGSYKDDMQNYCRQLRLCNQVDTLTNMLPPLQLALNLMDQSENPLDCSWTTCEKQHAFGNGNSLDQQSKANLHLDYMQLFNAYVMNSLEIMRVTVQRANHSQLLALHYVNIFYIFIDGLVFLALYRADRRKADLNVAKRAIKQLEWACGRSVNCQGLLLLLLAEKASIKNEDDHTVKQAFSDAIGELYNSGYLHFAAIANERAGEYAFARDPKSSEFLFSAAAKLYSEWGASAKIKSLAKQHPTVRMDKRAYKRPIDIPLPVL